MTQDNLTTGTTRIGVATTDISIGERIRWGPIVAGLFSALSTLIVLTILGAAIGLSAWNRGDTAEGWSIGAAIWGAISMIIAFLLGGWLAGRWSGALTRNTALLHGAMVWAVAIPLSLYLLGTMGTVMGTAAATSTADQRAARVDPMDTARTAGATIGDATAREVTTDTQRRAAGAAWGTLISLLLGLGAAAIGGYLAAPDREFQTGYRDRSTTPTT